MLSLDEESSSMMSNQSLHKGLVNVSRITTWKWKENVSFESFINASHIRVASLTINLLCLVS